MLVTDAHYATLFNNGALEKIDWTALGVADAKVITYDGTTLNYATQFVAPAYNPNLVSAAEAPKDWNDLLDPKWRGKLGISTATHHWARLGQVWGDERTTRFMEGPNAQQPTLGRLPELYTRLTLGEIPVYASITDSYANEAKQSVPRSPSWRASSPSLPRTTASASSRATSARISPSSSPST